MEKNIKNSDDALCRVTGTFSQCQHSLLSMLESQNYERTHLEAFSYTFA
jgi:hypothetical protein